MAQTALTVITLKQNNYAVVAGDLAMAVTAMDASNGNSFVATGKEVLVIQNTDSAPHTVTITSAPDQLGRTDAALTSYSIPANSSAAIEMTQLVGWIQTGQVVNMTTTSALVKISVLRHA
jgi:hypothetical protein